MGFLKGKSALQQESGLLVILLEATNNYLATLEKGSLGEFIVADWAGSFEKLKALNDGMLEEEAGSFEAVFKDEISLLTDYLGIAEARGFGQSWEELFKKDIEIAQRLLDE